MYRVVFLSLLTTALPCQAQDSNVPACTPMPLCAIDNPPVAGGATPTTSLLGGNNSVVNNPAGIHQNAAPPVQALGVGGVGSKAAIGTRRVCIPWC